MADSEMKSDDGRPELESPVFTVCTLNVGGRNTNSFEFEMRGDLTELGEQWGQRFAKANACLAETGPSQCQGLERAVDAAYAQMASEPRSTESVVTSLLNDATWEQALERVTRDCPMLFNACNLASLRVGRPAPLEMPENLLKFEANVEDDSVQQFFGAWLRWLHSTNNEDWAAWSKRAKKYSVSLGDAVAGLLIFDAMCFEALRRMYPSSESCGDIMREHLSFHDRLHFTTEVRESE